MGKGKGGGKNKKRAKKHTNGEQDKRELLFRDEEQEYAQVNKMLGNGRLEAKCSDGKDRLCHIRGTFRKRVWINTSDIVLLGMRSFDDDKADVIHKYTPEEARTLQAYGELPASWVIGGAAASEVGADDADGEKGIAFGEFDSSNSDSEEGVVIESQATIQEMLDAL